MDFRDRAHAQAIYDQQMSMLQGDDPSWSRGLMDEARDAVSGFDANFWPYDLNSWRGAVGLPVNYGDAVASPPSQNVPGGRVDVDWSVLDEAVARSNAIDQAAMGEDDVRALMTENLTNDEYERLDTMYMGLAKPDGGDEGPSLLDRGLGFVKDVAGGSPWGVGATVAMDPDLDASTRATSFLPALGAAFAPGIGGTLVGGIGSIANAMGYHQDLNAPGTYGLGITSAGNLTGDTQDAGGGFVQTGDLNVSNALRDMQSNQLIDTPFGAQRANEVAEMYAENEGANPFASEEDFMAAGGESNPYSADALAPSVDIGSAMAGLSDRFDLDQFKSSVGDFDATNQSMNTFNMGPSYNAIAGAVYDAGGGYNDIAPAIDAARQAAQDAINEQARFSNLTTAEVMDENAAGNFGIAGEWGTGDAGDEEFSSGGYVDAAQNLASQGRGGDTMLMHMRPDEVAGMAATGTVTQNPTTGLPENFLGGGIGAWLGPAIGAAMFGPLSIPATALATGLGAAGGQTIEAMALGTKDPLKQGMMAGLTAGVGSYALSGLGSAFGGGASSTATKGVEGIGNKFARSQGVGMGKQAGVWSPGDHSATLGDVAFSNVKEMPFSAPFSLGALGSSMADANKGGIDITPTAMGDPIEKKKFSRSARYQPTGDFREYGFNPQQQFFGAGQYLNEGGLAQGESMATQLTEQAISAIRGDHPEPKIAVSRYIEEFGEEAFNGLRGLVIQEDEMMQMAETDDGLLRGSDGGRDDLRRGTIDGDQDVRIASGEYIFSADDVALAGDGNTEAGARRLDMIRRNLRKKATGTEKRPDYVGEEGVEEVFEEVMTA